MEYYLKSGSQAIHIQKILAFIGLQHIDLSLKTTCGQLEICLYSPLSTNKMHFQNGKCQWQAWSKEALVFPVQEMDLVYACIWNENTSNTVHTSALTSQADHSRLANKQYPWLSAYIY